MSVPYYIPPSRRSECSQCGKAIGLTKTSAPAPICLDCRRANPRRRSVEVDRWTCGQCGKDCERRATRGQKPKWCSPECAYLGRCARQPERVCLNCNMPFSTIDQRAKFCSRSCSNKANKTKAAKAKQDPLPLMVDQRSGVRRAIEAADMGALRRALRSRSRIADECWEWTGSKTSANRNGGQYPLIRMRGGRKVQLHRLIVEVAQAAPLGVQAAHHKCGNSICVNPDHLQPVTNSDNVAEMLSRAAFVNRIAELEDALSAVAPHHPLLNRVPLAS